jgi:hypothetical protein
MSVVPLIFAMAHCVPPRSCAHIRALVPERVTMPPENAPVTSTRLAWTVRYVSATLSPGLWLEE